MLVVLVAAAAQTARNMAQRAVGLDLGVAAGTCVRFVFGVPISAAAVAVVQAMDSPARVMPAFGVLSLAWLSLGAMSQLAGTAALVAAMQRQSFATAVTCAKTEVLQAAALGAILLGEVPHAVAVAGMCLSLAGVWLLSRDGRQAPTRAASVAGIAFAAAAGGSFALSAVAFRESGLLLASSGSVAANAAWSVLFAQILQAVVMLTWFALREPGMTSRLLRSWRSGLAAGGFGAVASVFWFAAFIMRPAAEVMALGMIEVALSYLVSRWLLRETVTSREVRGLMLIGVGAATVCIVAR